MQHRELKLNGVIGYWSLVDGTPLDVVHDGLKPAGLSHCVPVEMTDKPSLRRALATVYPGRRQLIRPLEGKAGFAVIHESTDDSGDMVHEQQMQVLIIYPSHMGGEAYLVFRPADHFLVQRVRDEFDKEKGKVPASQMGQILVRCVEELKGVSLRPSGGFYWLAEEDVPKWEQVCDVIESVPWQNPSSRVTSASGHSNPVRPWPRNWMSTSNGMKASSNGRSMNSVPGQMRWKPLLLSLSCKP